MRCLRGALAVVAALGVLAACSSDPEPKVADPTPTVSTSASESVPASPSSSPTAALGPEDTVRAWVDAENEALATGSTDALKKLASAKCEGCENFAKPIEDVFAAGGSFQGGKWKLVNTNVETASESRATLTAAVAIARGVTTPEAGADPVPYAAQNHLMSFDLMIEGGDWRFSSIAFVS